MTITVTIVLSNDNEVILNPDRVVSEWIKREIRSYQEKQKTNNLLPRIEDIVLIFTKSGWYLRSKKENNAEVYCTDTDDDDFDVGDFYVGF